MDDPISPQMLAVVARGRHDRVALDVERYDPTVVVIDAKLRTASTICGDDWKEFSSRLWEASFRSSSLSRRGLG